MRKRILSLVIAAGTALAGAAFAETPTAGRIALAKAEGPGAWNYQAFVRAYEQSGRRQKVSEPTFNGLQERRVKALSTIEKYLTERFGRADPLVMKAFAEVPREYYHYHYQDRFAFADKAYEEENIKPWAIGYGSALSDYLGQAYMTQLTRPTPDSVVLEVGTGSGFQISVLSRIVKKAYSIEIIEPLGQGVARIFKPLGYHNIETRVGDGYFGWPEVAGGFDIIIVTCAAQYVPQALLDQLKPGGRMVIPIGQPFKKGGQFLYVYTKDKDGKVRSRKDVGVYFIPMTGEQAKKASVRPS
jgi:protein-L-isoaspartate(D-aspartate) O-methyltransferase